MAGMKLGLFFGDGEEIGEKVQMCFRCDFAQRTEESCDIFGGIFRLQFGDVIVSLFLKNLFRLRAVGQIKLISARIDHKITPRMAQSMPIVD